MIKYALYGLAALGFTLAAGYGFGPDRLKAAVFNAIVPPPREIKTISDLRHQQEVLGAFITSTIKTLSTNGTADQKKKLQEAQQALEQSKNLLSQLQGEINEDLPGVAQSIVKRLISIGDPEPTSIPPQCAMVCKP